MSEHRVCMKCNGYFLKREDDSPVCETCAIKAYKATIKAQDAEIAELKDEVENLNGELMFRPKYATLTGRITELETENHKNKRLTVKNGRFICKQRNDLSKANAEIVEFKVCNKRQSETIEGLDCGVAILRSKTKKQLTQANAENKELRKAIQAIDDIVYEECDAGMMGQIWAIVEGIKEVE